MGMFQVIVRWFSRWMGALIRAQSGLIVVVSVWVCFLFSLGHGHFQVSFMLISTHHLLFLCSDISTSGNSSPSLSPPFKRDANKAQSLEGYLWAITAFEPGKMQIRCLTGTHIIDIKPPLTIIYVGNGCEAYSNNLFIPAKSKLTSKDTSLVRHNYFQRFNEQYQNITRYSLIEDLGIVQLTPKEIAKIPDRLTALPKLQFKELKRRLVEIKQPLNIHSNVSFILVMIGGLTLCQVIAYVLW